MSHPLAPYGILLVAIVAEVIATVAMKAADGMTQWRPALLVAAGYGIAFWLLSIAVRTIPVGIVYSIWAGLGMAGAAIGARIVYGETLAPIAFVGMAVIAGGVGLVAMGQR